jgi:hypothetical protein
MPPPSLLPVYPAHCRMQVSKRLRRELGAYQLLQEEHVQLTRFQPRCHVFEPALIGLIFQLAIAMDAPSCLLVAVTLRPSIGSSWKVWQFHDDCLPLVLRLPLGASRCNSSLHLPRHCSPLECRCGPNLRCDGPLLKRLHAPVSMLLTQQTTRREAVPLEVPIELENSIIVMSCVPEGLEYVDSRDVPSRLVALIICLAFD